MSRANFPAYPTMQEQSTGLGGASQRIYFGGLTIREHFAAMCLQGMLANHAAGLAASKIGRGEFFRMCAEDAVGHADALIAELAK